MAKYSLTDYEKHGRPDPVHAEWVRGCADTIRHKAAALREALAAAREGDRP